MVLDYKPTLKVIFFVPKVKFYLVSPQSVRDSYVNFFLFFVLDESSLGPSYLVYELHLYASIFLVSS